MMREKVVRMARAIQDFEGWYPGSKSYRHNNPGNLRRWPGVPTVNGFAMFATEWDGFRALYRLLERAASGKSRIYKPDMTLVEFFARYAPSKDHNDPETYAKFVARRLGVTENTTIKEALS